MVVCTGIIWIEVHSETVPEELT